MVIEFYTTEQLCQKLGITTAAAPCPPVRQPKKKLRETCHAVALGQPMNLDAANDIAKRFSSSNDLLSHPPLSELYSAIQAMLLEGMKAIEVGRLFGMKQGRADGWVYQVLSIDKFSREVRELIFTSPHYLSISSLTHIRRSLPPRRHGAAVNNLINKYKQIQTIKEGLVQRGDIQL